MRTEMCPLGVLAIVRGPQDLSWEWESAEFGYAPHQKKSSKFFGWVFFLISPGSPRVCGMRAPSTCGEPNEIELNAALMSHSPALGRYVPHTVVVPSPEDEEKLLSLLGESSTPLPKSTPTMRPARPGPTRPTRPMRGGSNQRLCTTRQPCVPHLVHPPFRPCVLATACKEVAVRITTFMALF